MSHPEELNHETAHVNNLWEESRNSSVVKALKNGISLQEIIDKQEIKKPLEKPERMVCSDGRCLHNGETFCMAGSGILLDGEEFKQLIKDHGNIKCLTSHDGCGAAKIAFESYKEKKLLPENITTADEFAKWWTKSKAEEYGLDYQHISASEFNDSNHHEAGLMVDSTGMFNSELVDGLPNVFVSQSANCTKDSYVRDEINILTSIAFSDHGFGQRITKEDPFYIFICAKNQTDKIRLTNIAQEAISSYGDKVVIEAFVSPY